MHPAFRLENLKSLSPSVQLRANLCSTSFQINRNQPTFASETFAITPENVEPLLPVWYANLDPATIPNVDAIDAAQLAGERIHAVLGAELALKAIWGVKNVPPEVYPKLWARVWPWMQFLHTYRQHLNLNSRKEQDLYAPFVQTLRVFQRCNPS
ncbi:hypothetical protein C8R46DRAFT_359955 [Mycena filopes]|nr:hypothetical protein C8R46DRAFT_359955 [Mycena filopes]